MPEPSPRVGSARLRAMLAAQQNAVWCVASDATSDGLDEWVVKVTQGMVMEYPGLSVILCMAQYQGRTLDEQAPYKYYRIAARGAETHQLFVWNGSCPGSTFAIQNRDFSRLYPDAQPDLFTVSSVHNYGSIGTSEGMANAMDTVLAQIQDRYPTVPVTFVSENRQGPPKSNTVITRHNQRLAGLQAWCQGKGLEWWDVTYAFDASNRGLEGLVIDGVYPNEYGQSLWADVVMAHFLKG